MRPLVYLFSRSLVNGAKRAVTSPKRMISLIFFSLYYFFLAMRRYPSQEESRIQHLPVHLGFPSMDVLDGAIFAVMGAASILMLSGVISYKGGFRPADVDVLFPTPVSPRAVLIFRVLRDYLFTMLMPLAFAVLGWRGTSMGLQALFESYPTHGGDVLRVAWIAWMLLSLGWVSIGYGASMFVNRSDLRSERNRQIINWTSAVIVVGVLAYIGVSLYVDMSWNTALSVSHAPLLRAVLFPATAATAVVIGSFEGNWILLVSGMAGLLGIIVGGIALALTQVGWLYDQAAARGFDSFNMRQLSRQGDTFGVLAERARQGKLGKGRISKWISKGGYRRGPALFWKELVLQARGSLSGTLLFGFMLVLFGVVTVTLTLRSDLNVAQIMVVAFPCIIAYFVALISANSGFIELLRRVDLLKPLPFSATQIVFWEVVAKLPIPASIIFAFEVASTIVSPQLFVHALTGMLIGPCLALVITSAILLAVTLFPDYEDPTQRGLRGLLMLLSILICASPGIAIYIAFSYLLGLSSLLSAVPACVVMIAISAGLASASGSLYAGYNPSE